MPPFCCFQWRTSRATFCPPGPSVVCSRSQLRVVAAYSVGIAVQVYELTPNKRHLELTIEHASTLTLAWFFSGSARYAQRARDKIFTWFLDPAISMYPDLRVAGVHRGGTKFGRPEGIFDMARLADLLNAAVMLEGAEGIWSADDTRAMQSWVFQYVDFLKTEPVAVYARMMGNYIGTNVDEQLLAANLYLSAAPDTQAESRTEAEKIAYYSEVRCTSCRRRPGAGMCTVCKCLWCVGLKGCEVGQT